MKVGGVEMTTVEEVMAWWKIDYDTLRTFSCHGCCWLYFCRVPCAAMRAASLRTASSEASR